MTPQHSTLQIARWVEHRLDLSLGFRLRASRLYGVTVHDVDALVTDIHGAGRCSFLGERGDPYMLLAGPWGEAARGFDAAALVCTGWAAPMQADGTLAQAASRHPQRRRVRAVAVIDDDGLASVVRFEDDPTNPIGEIGGAIGAVVGAMEAMWLDQHADTRDLVNLRTTRGACSRRP